ncbi:hypothetical protein JR316_0012528 [Psilocybe cubensis]|uniref:Uncharacterized protein n=1 Tax=Psilocybe cubensis TaxID=181762 RepID=A0ACB8GJ62_PSICU|nr:hypothetical protein JR316_0012528 [Psilocybe cubensis]KAH9475417.1 hypothetical protein JR316_0012528 [Psilocybe cubensis]
MSAVAAREWMAGSLMSIILTDIRHSACAKHFGSLWNVVVKFSVNTPEIIVLPLAFPSSFVSDLCLNDPRKMYFSLQLGVDVFSELPGCHLASASEIIIVAYIFLGLSETVMAVLTAIKAYRHFQNSRSGWITKLYREGLLFYLYLVSISLANVLVPILAPLARDSTTSYAFSSLQQSVAAYFQTTAGVSHGQPIT